MKNNYLKNKKRKYKNLVILNNSNKKKNNIFNFMELIIRGFSNIKQLIINYLILIKLSSLFNKVLLNHLEFFKNNIKLI